MPRDSASETCGGGRIAVLRLASCPVRKERSAAARDGGGISRRAQETLGGHDAVGRGNTSRFRRCCDSAVIRGDCSAAAGPMDSQHSHRDCECSQRSGGGQLRAPFRGRKSTPGRRTRGAMLAKYLTLAVLAGMLNVGRGTHEPGTYVPCEVLEGVNLSPDRNVDSVKRT